MAKTIEAQIADLKEQRSALIQEHQPKDWGATPIEEQRRITAQILTREDVWTIEQDIIALRGKQEAG